MTKGQGNIIIGMLMLIASQGMQQPFSLVMSLLANIVIVLGVYLFALEGRD